MLSDKVRALYHKARADGMDAKSALSYARYLAAPLPYPDLQLPQHFGEWSDDVEIRDGGKFTGLTFRVKLDYDDSPDTSWLGEFTDDPDGAIKRSNAERREYKYIRPARTEAEHYRELRKLHYGKNESRALARKHVAQDIARLEQIASGDSPLFGVVVVVEKKGTPLGSASIWGIDDSAPHDYTRRDIIPELVAEALEEARGRLAALCDCGEALSASE